MTPLSAETLLPARTGNRLLSTATDRWVGVGPYYAMFPVDFAFDVVARYSKRGDGVLDPFAGRATGVFAAASTGRRALGIEINPVGWLYGSVKLRPAAQARVLERLSEVASLARAEQAWSTEAEALPQFFHWCYAPRVRRFLACAREVLCWRDSRVDATLMAFVLLYLHGKLGAALSNQMRDGKAMAPDYAVRWWRERGMRPPSVDPVPFLVKRIAWRYRKGVPDCPDGEVRLGDSTRALGYVRRSVNAGTKRPYQLLFTSPPYYGVTNYHYDQWLRLWMLGAPPAPTVVDSPWAKKFGAREDYARLLDAVFGGCSAVMTNRASVYVRTDARPFTLETTVAALERHFPRRNTRLLRRPVRQQTQTALFGDKSSKPGEIDIIMTA